VETVLLKRRRQTLHSTRKVRSMNQVAVKPAFSFKVIPGYCSILVQSFQVLCLGKCGVFESVLYGGLHGGLSCLWKAIEIE
jgi:hypothetical protein